MKKKILLVEDNPGDAELISELILKKYDQLFEIEYADRLSKAESVLNKSGADIVLLDLNLPDSKGLSGLKRVKELFPAIPVIVITGDIDEETTVRALKYGAQDYIVKGLIPEHYLKQIINYAIHRQEFEEKIKQSEEKYRSIIENIGVGVALIDAERNVVETNEMLNKWLPDAKSEEKIKCYDSLKCLCDGYSKYELCPVVKTFKDGQPHQGISQDGKITYQLSSFPLKNHKDGSTMVILLKEDISQRISMEVKLRRSQKMESLGTLSGGIAHDFNNILTAIQGFASLAQYSVEKDSLISSDLNEILKASNRAAELVRQILTFSRKTDFEKKPVRIDLIVEEVLKLLRSTIPSNIEIVNKITKTKDRILADSTQIHQIMMNLCTNASHAMKDSEGRLEISLNKKSYNNRDALPSQSLKPGDYLELIIKDTGCGIAPDKIDSIFDPYYTTKPLGVGTGLGLSVVQGIVKDSDGDILVESRVGVGSTFYLYFPIVSKVENINVREEDAVIGGNGERIVFIDDERQILEIGKRLLEKYNYSVHIEQIPKNAINYIEENKSVIDLILSDMAMPKMTGLDLAKELTSKKIDIPIIVMSGHNFLLPKEVEQYGIKALINKPLLIKDVVKTINKVLSVSLR